MIPSRFYPLLFITILLLKSPILTTAQSPPKSTSISPAFLDSILQDYAFRSLLRHRPITGVIYDGNVAAELARITVSSVRLRSGGLRRKGFHGFKEFDIPVGVFESPFVTRVVLVYQNLGNWSSVFYPLPGYVFLSPVVGLLAYNASHLMEKVSPEVGFRSPEVDLRSSEDRILIKFESLGVFPHGVMAKCVVFDLFGGVEFDRVVNGSVCSSVKQGHFGVVVEDGGPAAAPATVAEEGAEDPIAVGGGGGGRGGGGDGWWVGGVVGGVFVVVVTVAVVVVRRWMRRRRVEKMECVAEGGVPLAVAAVGSGFMPVAMVTRTKPVLENEYVC